MKFFPYLSSIHCSSVIRLITTDKISFEKLHSMLYCSIKYFLQLTDNNFADNYFCKQTFFVAIYFCIFVFMVIFPAI